MQYISIELNLNAKNEAQLKDRYDRKDDHKNRGHDDRRHQERQHREIRGDRDRTNEDNNNNDINVNNDDHVEYHFFTFITENTKSFGNNRLSGEGHHHVEAKRRG